MKKVILIALMIISMLGLFAIEREANHIFLEGNLDDWEEISPLYSDAVGDQYSGDLDFQNLKVVNDERFVFFYLEVSDEIIIQRDNDITLYLDTDSNSSTGYGINGIGAELEWNFGQKIGTFYSDSIIDTVLQKEIYLVVAPTFSSTVFEFCLERDSQLYGNELFNGNSFRIQFKDNNVGQDLLPDAAETITYTFDNTGLPLIPEISLSKPENSDFRIMTYNVHNDDFFETSLFDLYDRLLSAIDPEIICFQEISDHSALETKNLVEQMLPSSGNHEWFYDGIEPDIIICSRFPVLETYQSDGNGVFLLDLTSEVNSQLLVINAHLPYGDNNYDRQIEIDKIMEFIREAKEPGGDLYLDENTPIIILGDLNLVGYAQQLETLITGEIVNQQHGPSFNPDWDESDLTDLTPRLTELLMYFTWYNDDSFFCPGRLDFMIYTDYVLSAEKSFILFTPEMSAENLNFNNLQSNDSKEASDHIPVVSDFRVLFPTNSENHDIKYELNFDVYPNPAKSMTTINYQIRKQGFAKINVYNIKGQLVETLLNEVQNAGTFSTDWNVRDLSSGIYFMEFSNDGFSLIKKCLLLK